MEVQRASEYALGSGECQFLVEQARSSSSAAAGEGASSFKTQSPRVHGRLAQAAASPPDPPLSSPYYFIIGGMLTIPAVLSLG